MRRNTIFDRIGVWMALVLLVLSGVATLVYLWQDRWQEGILFAVVLIMVWFIAENEVKECRKRQE